MEALSMSILGNTYSALYDALCGVPPAARPWHFKWLATFGLQRDLRALLPTLGGKVLDLGCGTNPYRAWFGHVERYTGADIAPEPGVDVVLVPGEQLPFEDEAFDTLLCTQVLEHVADLDQILSEMLRVLAPGGLLLVSAPFLFNLHGAPHDYRRFTEYGLAGLLEEGGMEIVVMRRQGGIGSTLTVLWLNWIEAALNVNRLTRLLKGPLLPFWMVLTLACNLLGLLLDRLDPTAHFYGNLLALARKK